MSRKPRGDTDPLELEIERALHPGAFIPDRACISFVSDLDGVAAKIAKLVKADPAWAMALYETFLAGCYEKAEELDDSSGSFGQFVGELFCGWIEARQAAGADPNETATRLLAWMDHDPYGFCYHLEKDAVKAFDRTGLAAFERQIRARFNAAARAEPAPDGSFRDRPEYGRRRWGEGLRTLYLAQKNIAAYIALAEETGLTAQDCHAVATLLASRRKFGEALPWVDRGIDLDKQTPHGSMEAHDLARLRRELLTRLGRADEALEAAFHQKAIDAATGTDLHALIELLLDTKEIERLAELVRRSGDEALERVSHYASEPAAQALEKPHPDLAARLWRAQGMRIVNAKKSRYYAAAISNFERAMRCYERAGLTAEWERTVSRVRAEHRRKTGFMSGFEALVAGSGPGDRPSFLERARARWGKRLEAEGR